MLAYKLFRVRKDGTLGSLFIGRKNVVPKGEWLECDTIPTKGFAVRRGWHCVTQKHAPHLAPKPDRKWFVVDIAQYTSLERPSSQGEEWIIAEKMKVIGEA